MQFTPKEASILTECLQIFQDLGASILKIAKFLGKTLSVGQIRDLTEHLSFENMKRNPAVNKEAEAELRKARLRKEDGPELPFMRSGQTGQWKEVMSGSMALRFQKWEKEYLKNTDYPLILDV